MDPNIQTPTQQVPPAPVQETPPPMPTPEGAAQPTQPTPPPSEPLNKEANKKSVILISGIIILIIIFVILSIILLMRNGASTPKAATQTLNEAPTSIPTVTPIPSPEATTSSDLEEATEVDTGDPTTDITQVQQDASGL